MLHTHNVNGVADTVGDLSFGLAGVVVYVLFYTRVTRRLRAREPRRGSERPRATLRRAS